MPRTIQNHFFEKNSKKIQITNKEIQKQAKHVDSFMFFHRINSFGVTNSLE